MDEWKAYERISAKLKKRFVKRSQWSESIREFEDLMKRFVRVGNHAYAAFCCLAAARCSEAISDSSSETAYILQAGAQFWEAERDLRLYEFSTDGSTIGFEEYAADATKCYLLAVDLYNRRGLFSSSIQLLLELATILMTLRKWEEAAVRLKAAVELQKSMQIGALATLVTYESILKCYLQLADNLNALRTLSRIISISSSEREKRFPVASRFSADAFLQKTLDAEITRLLVLLIEDADMSYVRKELARITPKRDEGNVLPEGMDSSLLQGSTDQGLQEAKWRAFDVENEKIKLDALNADLWQSIITHCGNRDITRICFLQDQVWPLLTMQQRDLFNVMVEKRRLGSISSLSV